LEYIVWSGELGVVHPVDKQEGGVERAVGGQIVRRREAGPRDFSMVLLRRPGKGSGVGHGGRVWG
jgi:hypothetical protein